MDPAEQWAACVVFGELGVGVRTKLRFDWETRSWVAGDDDESFSA
jgi:hypothetical protein